MIIFSKTFEETLRAIKGSFGMTQRSQPQVNNQSVPTVWSNSSVVRVLIRSARGSGFESLSGHVLFPSCDIWWLSVGPCKGCEQQMNCLVGSGMIPSRFGDKSFKQGDIAIGLPCDPTAQWTEYSNGLRGVQGSSPGRVMCLFLPCGTYTTFYDICSSLWCQATPLKI